VERPRRRLRSELGKKKKKKKKLARGQRGQTVKIRQKINRSLEGDPKGQAKKINYFVLYGKLLIRQNGRGGVERIKGKSVLVLVRRKSGRTQHSSTNINPSKASKSPVFWCDKQTGLPKKGGRSSPKRKTGAQATSQRPEAPCCQKYLDGRQKRESGKEVYSKKKEKAISERAPTTQVDFRRQKRKRSRHQENSPSVGIKRNAT